MNNNQFNYYKNMYLRNMYMRNMYNPYMYMQNMYNPYAQYDREDAKTSDILYLNKDNKKLTPVKPSKQLLQSTGGAPSTQGTGTAVPVEFPKANPDWFNSGYPGTIDAGTATGGLVEYVPVSFFARNDGKIYMGFNEIDIYVGYLNSKGEYVKDIQIDGDYKKGDFVFAILLNKYAGAAQGTNIKNQSYWKLLSEVSNIQPGLSLSKSVAITSGVTTEESKTFSSTIGSTVGFKAGFEGSEISASLSVSLTNSFSTKVAVTTQITTTDTINFPAREKTQRAALYQFQEKYQIIPGDPLKGWVAYLNGTSTDEAKFFSSRLVCSAEQSPPFDYPSIYFAASYIMDPN